MPELDPLEFYGFLSPKARKHSRRYPSACRCATRPADAPRDRHQLEELKMDMRYLTRNVNEGFSGGEKKRNEILQLAVLDAEMAILDEIDSGLDIDALRDVAAAVNGLRKPERSVLMITHYQARATRRTHARCSAPALTRITVDARCSGCWITSRPISCTS